jgi:nucleoside 2-deoxyribosyltransferase
MYKIYCAGPLFNKKEQDEMQEIANALEKAGFSVFLPHRDGFEFSKLIGDFKEMGCSEEKANKILSKAIFALDIFEVLDSEGIVLNINGRVPDEGAIVEAGIAWNAGKTVVIYKTDTRTLINGTDNPLLLGLGNFKTINSIDEIPKTFRKMIQNNGNRNHGKRIIDNSNSDEIYVKGREISRLSKEIHDKREICSSLITLLDEE